MEKSTNNNKVNSDIIPYQGMVVTAKERKAWGEKVEKFRRASLRALQRSIFSHEETKRPVLLDKLMNNADYIMAQKFNPEKERGALSFKDFCNLLLFMEEKESCRVLEEISHLLKKSPSGSVLSHALLAGKAVGDAQLALEKSLSPISEGGVEITAEERQEIQATCAAAVEQLENLSTAAQAKT